MAEGDIAARRPGSKRHAGRATINAMFMLCRHYRDMRWFPALPVLLLPLAGCVEPTGALIGANAASVVVFGRGVGDLLVSAIAGQNCSIVRLDQGKSYCRPIEPPPDPAPFCTRSLGGVECWRNPEALPGGATPVADGPRALTPEQDARRLHPWP